MTTTPTISDPAPLGAARAAAARLSVQEKAQLVSELVQEIAAAASAPAASATVTAWDDFEALAADPAVAEPLPQDSAILISEMRR